MEQGGYYVNSFEKIINHTHSGIQTNRVRINIPHVNNDKSYLRFFIKKEGSSASVSTHWPYIRLNDVQDNDIEIYNDYGDTTSLFGGFYFTPANPDGSISGYIDFEYTADIDLNSTYTLRISHQKVGSGYQFYHTHIGDILSLIHI